MFWRSWVMALAVVAGLGSARAETLAELFPGRHPVADPAIQEVIGRLDYHEGEVELARVHATLSLPKGYYFVGGEDARDLLTRLRGLSEEEARGVLGVVLPKTGTPNEVAWVAPIFHAEMAPLLDAEAARLDFAAVLEATREASSGGSWRLEGWARPPFHDAGLHALFLPKTLRSADGKASRISYDVAIYGRAGALLLSVLAEPALLDKVERQVARLVPQLRFAKGHGYEDYIVVQRQLRIAAEAARKKALHLLPNLAAAGRAARSAPALASLRLPPPAPAAAPAPLPSLEPAVEGPEPAGGLAGLLAWLLEGLALSGSGFLALLTGLAGTRRLTAPGPAPAADRTDPSAASRAAALARYGRLQASRTTPLVALGRRSALGERVRAGLAVA